MKTIEHPVTFLEIAEFCRKNDFTPVELSNVTQEMFDHKNVRVVLHEESDEGIHVIGFGGTPGWSGVLFEVRLSWETPLAVIQGCIRGAIEA